MYRGSDINTKGGVLEEVNERNYLSQKLKLNKYHKNKIIRLVYKH